MSDTTTNGIRVQVHSDVSARAQPAAAERVPFAYHITISNVGDEAAQLVSRHWIITDADGDVQEVRGPGVVGDQPVLEPGGELRIHQLLSAQDATSATMHGSYQMVRPDGEIVRRRDRAVHAGGPQRA